MIGVDFVIGVDLLRDRTPVVEADYYVCGPVRFMLCILRSLRQIGVPDERVHHEFFGPKQALEIGDAAAAL